MFKEKAIKTPEQEAGEKYQARLEEVKEAVAKEIAVLKALEKPLGEYKGEETASHEYMEAGNALFTLLGWLKEHTRFASVKARLLENISVQVPDISKEVASQGLPDVAIPVLSWPKDEWYDENNNLGSDPALNDLRYPALFLSPHNFTAGDKYNPLAVTGIVLTNNSNLRSPTVHEAMHFLDFNQSLRKPEDWIIEEILAYRQQDNVQGEASYGEWSDRLKRVLEVYYERYGLEAVIPFEEFRVLTLKAIRTIKRLDKNLSHTAVTHLLLNSLTLKDILQWDKVSDDDLKAMIKNKYE